MALIFCHECGKQISDSANSCPNCGAANKHHKGGKKGVVMLLLVVVVAAVAIILFLESGSPPEKNNSETRQDRIDLADRLLSSNCNSIGNMCTEYIKNDLFASIVDGLSERKCDCIKEKLREQLADKYTLNELKAFEQKPIHQVVEIKDLIQANNEELKQCFKLINKVKDKLSKK